MESGRPVCASMPLSWVTKVKLLTFKAGGRIASLKRVTYNSTPESLRWEVSSKSLPPFG
jgi:hypothetical protein